MNKNYKTPKGVLLETINHNKSPFKIPTPFAHVSQGAISYALRSAAYNSGERKLIESKQRQIVKENKGFDLYRYFNVDNELLYSTNFDYRKVFLESILGDLNLLQDKTFIYVEHPNNYDELYDTLKEYPKVISAVRDVINNGFSASGQGITFIMDPANIVGFNQLAETNVDWENYIIVGYNTLVTPKNSMISPVWVFTHEVYHQYLQSADEQKVQKATFDYLLEYGYYNAIGIEFLRFIWAEIVNASRYYIENYSIIDYVVQKLFETEEKVLNTYVLIAIDTIWGTTGTEEEKGKMLDTLLNILSRNDVDINLDDVHELKTQELDNYDYTDYTL